MLLGLTKSIGAAAMERVLEVVVKCLPAVRRGRLAAREGRGELVHRRVSLTPERSHVGFMMRDARFLGGRLGAMVV